MVVDPTLLATLPRREFRAGLYEVVKYGVIASRALFDRAGRRRRSDLRAGSGRARAGDRRVLPHQGRCGLARTSARAGLRRILNFGHTVGHALEAVTKYRRFRHGEAVAYGMLAAADLAVARGAHRPSASDTALAALIARLGPLPPVADLPIAEVVEAIARDKKVVARHAALRPRRSRSARR